MYKHLFPNGWERRKVTIAFLPCRQRFTYWGVGNNPRHGKEAIYSAVGVDVESAATHGRVIGQAKYLS